MGTRKEIKLTSAEEMEERYTRAREVYTAVNMLMAHPPATKKRRVREVSIIKSAVDADQFSWGEVLLAGTTENDLDWQRELRQFLDADSDDEITEMEGVMPVKFDRGRGIAVITSDGFPEFSSGRGFRILDDPKAANQ